MTLIRLGCVRIITLYIGEDCEITGSCRKIEFVPLTF